MTKAVRSTTQNADGTWTVVYDLAVSNPSSKYATTYELTDTLAFGTGIDVNTATVTGPAGVVLASPAWDGNAQPVVVSGQALAASSTDEYTVTVNATVADGANSDCSNGGGFANASHVSLVAAQPDSPRRNAVRAAAVAAGQDASACSEPGLPTVSKTVRSVTPGSTPRTWVVRYDVTVANGTAVNTTYSLTDDPGLATGAEITAASASWIRSALDGSGPGAATDVPGWTGVAPHDGLAVDLLLPARSKATYSVTLDVTVPSDIADGVLACSPAGSGHGYFNQAVLATGNHTFPVSACAPVTNFGLEAVPIPPITGPPASGPLAYTGVQVWQQLMLGIGLLLLGIGLMVTTGRRRHARRHAR